MSNKGFDKKDILKEILLMIAKIAAFFVWWCFTLAVISLLLVNVWRIKWQQMLMLAVVLTVITTVVHIIGKIREK